MKENVIEKTNWKVARSLESAYSRLVGAMEKRFEKIKTARVDVASSLNLNHLPNYVSYKAALIREKILLQHVVLSLACLLVIVFVIGRFEVSGLEEKLRRKEYILAPGVSDFIPASPQSVPDSYVQHAVSDFVATLGNTNPSNIEERFRQLSSSMSPALQIQFQAEADAWITKAKRDNISEMVTVLEKTVASDDSGRYRVIVRTRADSFVNNESIGYRNEVVEMELKLVPPDNGRRWYLEITALSRNNAEAYSAQKNLGGSTYGK